MKTTKSPIAAIDAELANLATARGTLESRKADATARLEAARSARKSALGKDAGADLTNLTRAVRDGEDELDTLDDVLADLANQVADAEARLQAARDSDDRAAAAKTLGTISQNVDKAAAELDDALALVGKAYAALVSAVPPTLKVVDLNQRLTPTGRGYFTLNDGDGNASPNDMARAILAEGLAKVCPGSMGMRSDYPFHRIDLSRAEGLGSPRPSFKIDKPQVMPVLSATEAATALISDRLHKRAAAILAGEQDVDLADLAAPRAPEPKVQEPAQVQIFALEDFCFYLDADSPATLMGKRWVRSFPEDVADAAVAAGVALRTDTPDGAAEFEDEKRRREAYPRLAARAVLTRAECQDIGTIRGKPRQPDPVEEYPRFNERVDPFKPSVPQVTVIGDEAA